MLSSLLMAANKIRKNVFILLTCLVFLVFFYVYIAHEKTDSMENEECPIMRHLVQIDDHDGIEVEDSLFDANSFKAEKYFQHSPYEHAHQGEDDLAQWMFKKVRILCWVATHPGNLKKKAVHVLRTWGKRCNTLLFVSGIGTEEVPSEIAGYMLTLDMKDERKYLWVKTRRAFKHIYEHYLDNADWFMKADDDTFVVLENLRYLLFNQTGSDTPLYYGSCFKPYAKQGYMSGGGGYVVNRAALKLFGEKADAVCERETASWKEDAIWGQCMEKLGVVAQDSRDVEGRWRFFPFVEEHHINNGGPSKKAVQWFEKNQCYPMKKGMDCCSDTAITFHYVSPYHMYSLEYLIYHLKPFGIGNPLNEEFLKHFKVKDISVEATSDLTSDATLRTAEQTANKNALFVCKKNALFVCKKNALFVYKKNALFVCKKNALFVYKKNALLVCKKNALFVCKKNAPNFGGSTGNKFEGTDV
ncbi:unnamed protein product [Cyprideis torosa]|uniref:N-acetylgalactosaminide beta-1,3-galactosyltransferase n=1 Tax=Cyprideis torosa TaxID=163714 RepID=A0A7R8WBG9_9CRUS|nr:unnamed protein product [Cyprideis torosa]CAG0892130.1 unnamed protein product [Cyprideis torosa]